MRLFTTTTFTGSKRLENALWKEEITGKKEAYREVCMFSQRHDERQEKFQEVNCHPCWKKKLEQWRRVKKWCELFIFWKMQWPKRKGQNRNMCSNWSVDGVSHSWKRQAWKSLLYKGWNRSWLWCENTTLLPPTSDNSVVFVNEVRWRNYVNYSRLEHTMTINEWAKCKNYVYIEM